MLDYLTNHKERTKIGLVFNSWHDISNNVAQGSMLVPLLFNDLFFSVTRSEIFSFVDDDILYSCNKNRY